MLGLNCLVLFRCGTEPKIKMIEHNALALFITFDDNAAHLNWSEIERLAASDSEDSRDVCLARVLIAIRDETWKPLLLPACPRKVD